jgi:tRNA G37 N-methylase TrmD
MSHLQYFCYEGFGERVKKDTHYSQAVRIGDIIKISGQGKLLVFFKEAIYDI